MPRYIVMANPSASSPFPFIVVGEGRPRYFSAYGDALSWVACMGTLERDIARVVRLRMLRREAA